LPVVFRVIPQSQHFVGVRLLDQLAKHKPRLTGTNDHPTSPTTEIGLEGEQRSSKESVTTSAEPIGVHQAWVNNEDRKDSPILP
jgi:hypothetical protein